MSLKYKKIILKINKYLTTKHLITDVGSSKTKSIKIIKEYLKKDISCLSLQLKITI